MLIHGDCKDIVPTLSKVDLIYLDPPFNTGRDFIEFDDRFKNGYIDDKFKWIVNNHSKDMAIYITFLYERLMLAYDLLKDTGSLYLHCDPTASHYLKVLLDSIFGKSNFKNEIVWCYAGGGVPKKDFPRKHDVILRYTKSKISYFNVEYKKYGIHNKTGKRATSLNNSRKLEYRKEGTPVNDWWNDIKPLINWSVERTGYPTQKPLKLLERIIKASSNEGDLVLDPFCGSGTALVAAKSLNRNYIGIDINKNAIDLCNKRLSVDNLQK